MKTLSRSISIMFLFDFIILFLTTSLLAEIFGFSYKIKILSAVLILVAGLITLFLKGYYRIREFNPTLWNIYRLFEGVIFANLPLALILAFFLNKLLILKFVCVNIIIIYMGLLIYRLCFHYYLFHVKKVKNVLILGSDKRAVAVANEIQAKYALKMNVVGFIDEKEITNKEVFSDNKIPVFSNIDNLREIIKKESIDIVVIAQSTDLLLTVPRYIKIFKMPEFYEMVTGKYYIDEKTITELYYQYVTHRSLIYDFCKRAYDIIAALIILLVTLPITGFTAIRIYLTDHENPIYTQTRVGIDGKEFKCYKLRTMWANNYVPKAGKIKAETAGINDDRVIPFCRFVRKARFDEIPQMINILKGDMSIVGPRAEWQDLVNIYKKEIPFYSCRMWVKTGWTGWAQINQGHCVSNEDVMEKLQYDLYYLKNRNILWEIFILVKAVFLALGGRHE